VNTDGGDALTVNFRVYFPTFCIRLDAHLGAVDGAEVGLSVIVEKVQDAAREAY
jgi:hypothetical protein